MKLNLQSFFHEANEFLIADSAFLNSTTAYTTFDMQEPIVKLFTILSLNALSSALIIFCSSDKISCDKSDLVCVISSLMTSTDVVRLELSPEISLLKLDIDLLILPIDNSMLNMSLLTSSNSV